jgi:large subunit ribosomal protein L29
MKSVELRELPDDELLARLEELKEELFNLRFQGATGQLDNPMRVKQVRHDVARVLTVLRERHLEEELETQIAAADRVSLEDRRAAIASGELKGVALGELAELPGDELAGDEVEVLEKLHGREEEAE